MMMTAAMTETTTTAMTETTATAETTELPLQEEADRTKTGRSTTGLASWVRRRVSGLRSRVVVGYVVLLALTFVASFLVARQVLLNDLDERINHRLDSQVVELGRLAGGNDPATGRPFGSNVRRILRTYLQRTTPPRDGMLVTFVGGKPFLRSGGEVPYRLDRDRGLTARWRNLRAPDRGRVDTPAGPVDFLAVPLRSEGRTRGVLAAAVFREPARASLDAALRAAGAVGAAMLLLGALLAWGLAGGVVRPIRQLTGTARAISEGDLSRRIPLEGDDEVAQLAETFNDMLGRLEVAFATQRRFIDDAGHELRTPITIVRGHLELLDEDPTQRRETVALVLDELDRMSRIVNDLLVLAKAQQPDFLELATVDLGALTAEVHAKSEALAEREWRLESRGRGLIVADRQRLTQALVQLAQNAAQHTCDGDVIALGSIVENGEARFWVRDRGPGIPLDDQQRIFDRFARGSQGQRAEGAGLGLAIVRAIAEAHQGRLELYSRPGAGATFTLVVPTDQPQPANGGKAP
jgi:two-component system OmpR family sensor kinase